jgi:hypothetical protein
MRIEQQNSYPLYVPLITYRFSGAGAGADQPSAPIEHGPFGAIPSSHLGWVGFDLLAAIPAHTISRTPAVPAATSVIGGGSYFMPIPPLAPLSVDCSPGA